MNSNLLLFKTVIAGDSWGSLAVPVIENHPATAIIWVGSQLTLVFGVLNLIVAVVVDTFADARDRDILNLAEEMEHDLEADKLYLERMFDRIDEAGAGRLSLEELVEGARKDHEFQSRLRVMDIDEADLVQLFDMIDSSSTTCCGSCRSNRSCKQSKKSFGRVSRRISPRWQGEWSDRLRGQFMRILWVKLKPWNLCKLVIALLVLLSLER